MGTEKDYYKYVSDEFDKISLPTAEETNNSNINSEYNNKGDNNTKSNLSLSTPSPYDFDKFKDYFNENINPDRNIEYERAANQPGSEQAWRAVSGGIYKGLLGFGKDVGYLLDVENNVDRLTGAAQIDDNWLSTIFEDLQNNYDENHPIYRYNPEKVIDLSDPGFYWSALQGITESAVEFGLVGAGAGATVGKGLKYLAGLEKLGMPVQNMIATVGTAATTNFVEGKTMALESFKKSVNAGIKDFSKKQYQKAIDEAKQWNPNMELGELNARATELYEGEKYTKERVAEEKKIRQIAGEEANKFQAKNMVFMLSDMIALNGMFRGKGVTRNLLKDKSFKNTALEIAKQAPTEYFEEVGQGVIQNEGEYQAMKRAGMDVSDISSDPLKRTLGFIADPQNQLEGLMGLFGGPVQHVLVQAPMNAANKGSDAQYREDQTKQTEQNKQLVNTLLIQDAKFAKEKEDANSKDDEEAFNLIEDEEFNNLAYTNFVRGTIEHLENTLQDVINMSPEEAEQEGYASNYKEKAQEKLDKIPSLEKTYMKIARKNGGEKDYLLHKRLYDIETKKESIVSSLKSLQNKKEELYNKIKEEVSVLENKTISADQEKYNDLSLAIKSIGKQRAKLTALKNEALLKPQTRFLNKRKELDEAQKVLNIRKKHKYKFTEKEIDDQQLKVNNLQADVNRLSKFAKAKTKNKATIAKVNKIYDTQQQQLIEKSDKLKKQREEVKKTLKENKEKVEAFDKNKYADWEELEDLGNKIEDLNTVNNLLNEETKKIKQNKEEYIKEIEKQYIENTTEGVQNDIDEAKTPEEKTDIINKQEDPIIKEKLEKDNEKNIQEIKRKERVNETREIIQEQKDNEIVTKEEEITPEEKTRKEEVKTEEIINTIGEQVSNDAEKQDRIKDEIDTVEQDIEKLNSDIVSVDTDGTPEYGYGVVKKGYDLIAYLSRFYKKIIRGEKVTKVDIDNELNEQFVKLLNPNKYGKGTKVILKVLDEDNIIINSDTQETWGDFKERNKLSKTSDIYNDNVPIKIVDESDNLLGYLHQTSWITEENVFKNVKESKANLQKIRKHIIANKEYKTTISSKATGVLFRNKDGVVTTREAIKDPNAIFAIGGLGELISDRNISDLQINNIDRINAGTTYVVVQIGTNENGKLYSALPLLNKKLSDCKQVEDIVNSIENAIRIWYYSNAEEKGKKIGRDEQQEAVYIQMGKEGFDLSSLEGLSNYINQFIQVFHTGGDPILEVAKNRFQDGEKGISTKTLLGIDNSQIQFLAKNGRTGFIHIGVTDIDMFGKAMSSIKNSVLLNLYSNIDKKSLLNSSKPVKIISSVNGVLQVNNLYSNYINYLKESTATDILSHVVDTDENGSDVYGYTIQPKIELDFSEIIDEEPTIDTPPTTKKETSFTATEDPNDLFEDYDDMPLVNPNMDWNTGEEIVTNETDLLPEVGDKVINDFTAKVNDIIIQDLDIHKQDALVDLLYKNILTKVLASKEDVDINPIFNDTFKQIKDNYAIIENNIKKAEKNLAKATSKDLTDYINKFTKELKQLKGAEKTFNSYLENQDRFIKITKQKLIGENLITKGNDVGNELINDNEKNNEKIYDNSSYQENRDASMSKDIKKFLANTRQYNDNGTIKKNILNTASLMSYEEVYNKLQVLTNNVIPDYKTIITILENYVGTFPFLQDVLNNLNDESNPKIESIRKELTMLLTNHYSNSQFITYGKDKGGNNFARVVNSNSNSIQESVLEGWNDRFADSPLIKVDNEGVQTLGREKAEELMAQSKVWQLTPPEKADSSVRNWLLNFGIILSDKTWKDLEQGKFQYGRNNFSTWKELFTKSAFNILANQYLKKNKGRNIDSILPIKESVVKNLAKAEGKYSKNFHSTSHREGVKTVHSYGTNKLLTDNVRDLHILEKVEEKDGTIVYTNKYITDKLSTIFEQNGLWLNEMAQKNKDGSIKYASNGQVVVDTNNPYFANIDFFTISLEALKQSKAKSRENRELNKLTPAEIEFTKVCHLTASRTDQSNKNNRIIGLIYPTTSDKTTVVGTTTKAVDIDFDFATGDITDTTLDMLYDNLVLPEINRILKFEKFKDDANIEKNYKMGGSSFIILPELNNSKYGLFNKNGTINSNIQTVEFKNIIKGVIKEYIDQLVTEKLEVWKHDQILTDTGENNKIDNSFYNNFKKVSDTNRSKGIATDMVIQYLVGNVNIFQTFIGDPAMFFKSKQWEKVAVRNKIDPNKSSRQEVLSLYTKEDFTQESESNFVNISKRLASEIAPGEQGDGTMNNQYKQVCCNDRIVGSKAYEEIEKILGNNADDYKEGIKSTDAQEYTTLLEDLYGGNMFGKIKIKGLYPKVYNIITKELTKKVPNTDYLPQLREGLTTEEFEYLKAFVLQPKKPVYSKTIVDKDLGISRRVYIKSSSFTLSPFLTSGIELNKLRIAMETQGVSRLAYNTAIKVGNVANPATIWNDDGTFKDDVVFDESNTLLLPRSGFRIQQEVPYNPLEDSINKVSQASKNLFNNIANVEGFTVPWLNDGNPVNGKELEDGYLKAYKELFEIQKQDLLDELEFDSKTGSINIQKLRDTLEEEAIKRNYPLPDIHTFDLDEELRLLAFSSSSDKYEALLNSIVTNRIIKIRFPGKSYVLGADTGFTKLKAVEDVDLQDYDIIWTSKDATGELQAADGTGRPDQVIMPWDFKEDIDDFIKDGVLDLDKVPQELLKRYGMRIPNQGFSSQSKIEVAGFFRGNVGDLIIAPKEFVVRMGSDFDVDHLYVYKYGYYFDKNTGKLKKSETTREKAEELYNRKNDLAVDNLLKGMLGEEYAITVNLDKEKFIRKMLSTTLKNRILDTHLAVHSNPDQRVQRQILQPLDFWKLDKIADTIDNLKPKGNKLFTGMSDEYQKQTFIDGAVGKVLVGVFSNSSMFNVLVQNKNISLKKFTTRFGNNVSRGDLSSPYTLSTQRKLRKHTGDKDINDVNPYDYLKYKDITYKSEVHSGYQSAAVDHANEHILNKFNVNSDTAGIVNLLNQLGFAEEVPYFLTQPIVLEYLDEIKRLRNSEEFVANAEEIAYTNVKNNYKFDNNKYTSTILEDLGSSSLTITKMSDMIKGVSTNDYTATQYAILTKFKLLQEKGRAVTKLQGLLNVDSQGIGQSLIESNIKEESLTDLDKVFDNFYALFGLNTIPGMAISNGLVLNNILWNRFFPYRNPVFKSNFTILETIFDKEEASRSSRAEFRKKMWKEMKKYMFSNPYLFSTDKDATYNAEYIDNERIRLFTQSKGNDCLAQRVIEAQKLYPDNMFLQGLNPLIRKNGQANTVGFKAIKQDAIDAVMYRDMASLLIYNNPIKGKDNTQKLFQDLVWGAYLNGGIQEANQYIKFIPAAYLHLVPFAKEITNLMSNIENNSKFINKLLEDKTLIVSEVIKQIVQHNPELLPKLELTFKNNKFYSSSEKKHMYGSVHVEEGNPFKVYKLVGQEQIDGIDNMVYEEIPSLYSGGRNKISQYNYLRSGYTKSVFGSKVEKEKEYILSDDILFKSKPGRKIRVKQNAVKYNTNKLGLSDSTQNKITGKNSIKNALNYIKVHSDSPFNKRVAQLLFDNFEKFDLDKLEVKLVPNLLDRGKKVRGKITRYTNKKVVLSIDISEDSSNADMDVLEHTILHEFLHVITSDIIRHPQTTKQKSLVKALDSIRLETINLIKADKVLSKQYQEFLDNDKSIVNDIDVLFYGLDKTTEFASVIFSNEVAQKTCNELMINNKSILSTIMDKFIKLLNTLGFNIKKGSVTQAALENIMNIITTATEVKTFQVDNTETMNTNNTVKNIYLKLGKKTQSENIIIKSWKELKDNKKAITSQGIVSTRIYNSNEHFGNPFSPSPAGKTKGLIKTTTPKEAVEKYIEWLTTDKYDFDHPFKMMDNQDFNRLYNQIKIMSGSSNKNTQEQFATNLLLNLLNRKNWIKEQLKSDKLKGKPILYYKELGEPSHATALDYLINKYNFNEAKEVVTSEKDLLPEQGIKQEVNKTSNSSSNLINRVQYQNNTGKPINEFIASEKTIRDLAERIADRIGLKVKYISDRTKDYKGKLEGDTAVINLAYATLDTPIHEILGHPIIRAIKNRSLNQEDSSFNKLYENLLEELSTTQKGKEVFDRVKRDYTYKKPAKNLEYFETSNGIVYELKVLDPNFPPQYYKTDNSSPEGFLKGKVEITKEEFEQKRDSEALGERYTLEEQQEEAIVELLGLYTADRLDNVKDGKLISLLKRLLKEMKAFMCSLLGQKEVEIDKLPDNMTLGDLADLLAYSNSKLILPGNEVVYTTPDNQTFKTYQEASNHISELTRYEEITLIGKKRGNKIIESYTFKEGAPEMGMEYPDTYNIKYKDGSTETLTEFDVYRIFDINPDKLSKPKNIKDLKEFISKNKEYEQSKEIIEEWKRVNGIKYDPEEVYSRGQGFYSVVGAYSDFDVELMFQNLLAHIEDNKKAGGEFTISAFTKPVDKKIGHLEGGGGKIKFKIFPKSKDIKWAANTDVYSGSVWDASEKVSKDTKSELIGVSYTKAPSLNNINSIQPNLANIIDNLEHYHNELGIELTGSNFRLEYDDNVPYSTKKLINKINGILDEKYGKLVEPAITQGKNKEVFIVKWDNDDVGETTRFIFDNIEDAKNKQKILNDSRGITNEDLKNYGGFIIEKGNQKQGIQPAQTRENLKESINSIKRKSIIPSFRVRSGKTGEIEIEGLSKQEAEKKVNELNGNLDEYTPRWFIEEDKGSLDKKEYTSQAETNIRVAALKKGYRKFSRSLIRSEVVKSQTTNTVSQFEEDELPFQKVSSKTQEVDNLPEFIPSSKKILDKYNELDKDNNSKLLRADTERKDNNLSVMNKRAERITNSQPYYNAVVKEILDTKNPTSGKKFYKIYLQAKEELNDINYLADIIPEKYMEEMRKQCK